MASGCDRQSGLRVVYLYLFIDFGSVYKYTNIHNPSLHQHGILS